MASRKYTDEDYGICMAIRDGATVGQRAPVNDIGGIITIARVDRARLLNLVDGPFTQTVDGELVRLAGLGVKTADEGTRLGKPILT